MNEFYVYMIFHPLDEEKPIYIGKGKGYRLYRHLYITDNKLISNRHLSRIINKYGKPKIIKIAENLDEEQAFGLEKELISLIGREDRGSGTLVNFTDGGEGISGYKMTDDAKFNLIKLHKGRKRSAETKMNIGEKSKGRKHNLGRKHTEEAKLKMSNAKKGRPSPNKGKEMSEQSKLKMSNSRKGKPSSRRGAKLSEETKIKISNGHKGIPSTRKGIPRSQETKDKIRNTLKNRSNTHAQI